MAPLFSTNLCSSNVRRQPLRVLRPPDFLWLLLSLLTPTMIPFYNPLVAPAGIAQGQAHPHHTANPLSKLFFHWVTPVLKAGYSRPLEQEGKFSYVVS